MATRKLTREGEPTQRTKSGLEIPVPTRGEFDAFLGGVKKAPATKRKPSAPSKSGSRTR